MGYTVGFRGAILVAMMLVGALPAAAETCSRPAKVKIPDPAKADAKDFEKSFKDLTAYHGAMSAYNDCLKKESAEASAEYVAASAEYEKAVKAYNAAAEKANKSQ